MMSQDNPQTPSIFARRPRPGDIWDVPHHGKGRPTSKLQRKTVGRILKEGATIGAGGKVLRPARLYVWWDRQPRGRYTAVSVRWLLRNGRLIYRKPTQSLAQSPARESTR